MSRLFRFQAHNLEKISEGGAKTYNVGDKPPADFTRQPPVNDVEK